MWKKVSDTRYEYIKDGRLAGVIHLTDDGWLPRVWEVSGRVHVLDRTKDELLAKVRVERAA